MGMPTETTTSARDRIMGEIDKLPPFSPVLTRLLATLADDDVSFGQMAAIIETDAVLAGNLLRVVNSPLYGRIATINSVRHAVAIMGTNKIRNLVLGMSVARRWASARVPGSWNSKQFNVHSLAVAVLSDLVVLEAPVPYPEGAFTAGLLHDVGKLLIAAADHYININGLGMPPYCHHPAEPFEDCRRKIGLNDCILKVAETFEAEFEAVRTFF